MEDFCDMLDLDRAAKAGRVVSRPPENYDGMLALRREMEFYRGKGTEKRDRLLHIVMGRHTSGAGLHLSTMTARDMLKCYISGFERENPVPEGDFVTDRERRLAEKFPLAHLALREVEEDNPGGPRRSKARWLGDDIFKDITRFVTAVTPGITIDYYGTTRTFSLASGPFDDKGRRYPKDLRKTLKRGGVDVKALKADCPSWPHGDQWDLFDFWWNGEFDHQVLKACIAMACQENQLPDPLLGSRPFTTLLSSMGWTTVSSQSVFATKLVDLPARERARRLFDYCCKCVSFGPHAYRSETLFFLLESCGSMRTAYPDEWAEKISHKTDFRKPIRNTFAIKYSLPGKSAYEGTVVKVSQAKRMIEDKHQRVQASLDKSGKSRTIPKESVPAGMRAASRTPEEGVEGFVLPRYKIDHDGDDSETDEEEEEDDDGELSYDASSSEDSESNTEDESEDKEKRAKNAKKDEKFQETKRESRAKVDAKSRDTQASAESKKKKKKKIAEQAEVSSADPSIVMLEKISVAVESLADEVNFMRSRIAGNEADIRDGFRRIEIQARRDKIVDRLGWIEDQEGQLSLEEIKIRSNGYESVEDWCKSLGSWSFFFRGVVARHADFVYLCLSSGRVRAWDEEVRSFACALCAANADTKGIIDQHFQSDPPPQDRWGHVLDSCEEILSSANQENKDELRAELEEYVRGAAADAESEYLKSVWSTVLAKVLGPTPDLGRVCNIMIYNRDNNAPWNWEKGDPVPGVTTDLPPIEYESTAANVFAEGKDEDIRPKVDEKNLPAGPSGEDEEKEPSTDQEDSSDSSCADHDGNGKEAEAPEPSGAAGS